MEMVRVWVTDCCGMALRAPRTVPADYFRRITSHTSVHVRLGDGTVDSMMIRLELLKSPRNYAGMRG